MGLVYGTVAFMYRLDRQLKHSAINHHMDYSEPRISRRTLDQLGMNIAPT